MTTINEGITVGELLSKVKNYRFSAHTFVAGAGVVAWAWANNPEIGKWVEAHSSVKVQAFVAFLTLAYARYSLARRSGTITTTIEPGETGIVAAEAVAGTVQK